MRTRVKICGFTCADDALTAAAMGVDAIGLVFYPPSPRNIGISQAADLVKKLPAFVTVVALFVDAEAEFIREVLTKVAVDCIQFHGDESPEHCAIYGKPYIKAIRVQNREDIIRASETYSEAAALLLDAFHPGMKGGSGRSFDWNLLPENLALPVILAGGLSPENVRAAITACKPYAVDVSSGVELDKGCKDAAKMSAFLSEVYEGDKIIT